MDNHHLRLTQQLRHELHEHPELSGEEIWTKQHLINFFKANTNLEIVDKGQWFYAIYRAGHNKQNIAFRADFDAIPISETIQLPYGSKIKGISHKCGHDGHSATLAGLALEISKTGADKNVFFLFQHAEETGEGAAQCTSFIKENNIDEIFAFHNMSGMELNSVNVIDGTAHYASKGMTIHMEGTPAHASEPEKGKNPAFAIAKIIDYIPELTSPKNNKGRVVCTIIHVNVGEKAFGISAGQGDLLLTIRAFYEEELEKLEKNLEELILAEAKKYGLEVSISYNDVFPETVNHKESSNKIRLVCHRKGFKLVEMKEPFSCSEDFGYYLKETKGAILYIGNGIDYPNIHTVEYDFPDEIIETAIEIFKGLINL